MNPISDILRLPVYKSKATSERASVIEDFVKQLNVQGRLYKPSRIAFMVSHLNLEDLYWFYKKCYSSENFNRCFFGLLKVK